MNPASPVVYIAGMYARRRHLSALLLLGAAVLGGCRSAPPYQGLSGDELFALAEERFAQGDWDETVRALERLLFAEPTFPRIVEARLRLAEAYYNKGDYLTAVSEYTRILDRHPGHELAPRAALGVCRSYAALSPHVQRDQTYTVQAVNACENVASDYAGRPEAQEASEIRDRMVEKLAEKIYIGGEFYFTRKLYDSAIIYFEDVIEAYPRSRAAAKAMLRLYEANRAIGWNDVAEQWKERLLREFPESPEARRLRANGDPSGG